MDKKKLVSHIQHKKSCLCVGLDTDIEKLPDGMGKTPANVLAFNRAIVEATKAFCVAYKINTAFYECMGAEGWKVLEETASFIPDTHFKIADAKRGDIGNTSAQYAKTFLQKMPFDAVTISPYMGCDSAQHFLEYPDKWAIVLALTSNPGSADFQQQKSEGKYLWQRVLETMSSAGTEDNMMFVVGATRPEAFRQVRQIVPGHFLLVPGVGTQGGSLKEVIRNGRNKDIGLLINVSRKIIYASEGKDFAVAAAARAKYYHDEMKTYL